MFEKLLINRQNIKKLSLESQSSSVMQDFMLIFHSLIECSEIYLSCYFRKLGTLQHILTDLSDLLKYRLITKYQSSRKPKQHILFYFSLFLEFINKILPFFFFFFFFAVYPFQIMENAEINNIIKIVGLQYKKNYEDEDSLKTLRYGKIMIMTEQVRFV